MLTNGHVKVGYTDPDSDVPSLPLRSSGTSAQLFNGYGVSDSKGMLMAFFRNEEDRTHYIAKFNKKNKTRKKPR
jgi:hypothetical protein